MQLKRVLRGASVACVLAGGVASAGAQSYARLDLGGFIEVGGEAERYARVLQLAAVVPLTPWSIQPFSPSQVARLRPTGQHPWQERYLAAGDSAGLRWLRPQATVTGNTTYPFQVGGGPTWAGRGLTGEVQAGVAVHWKSVYGQFAPLAFAAQNTSFELAPNGQADSRRFADARYPSNIDAPQRFGDGWYARATPGTSSLAIDTHRLLAGVSTAPQRWGPARDYPLVLGPNAGGFPMMYAGTSEPWNLWLFGASGRVVYGKLTQSAYSAVDTGNGERLGSGLVVVATPRGVPGLELGASRFLHRPWSGLTLSTLTRPFSGIVSNPTTHINEGVENQVASFFFRWAVPQAKVEVYGELYREDYPAALHKGPDSFVESPDDYTSYTMGFQRVFTPGSRHFVVFRGEIVDGEPSHQQRGERGFSVPLPPYVHSGELQGHTLGGMLLGSPEAYGGAGWRVGVDDFDHRGRRSIGVERMLRLDWLPTLPAQHPQVEPDVMYALRAEWLRFHDAREIGVTVIPSVDLNRNLVAKHDAFNLTVALTSRGWP